MVSLPENSRRTISIIPALPVYVVHRIVHRSAMNCRVEESQRSRDFHER